MHFVRFQTHAQCERYHQEKSSSSPARRNCASLRNAVQNTAWGRGGGGGIRRQKFQIVQTLILNGESLGAGGFDYGRRPAPISESIAPAGAFTEVDQAAEHMDNAVQAICSGKTDSFPILIFPFRQSDSRKSP